MAKDLEVYRDIHTLVVYMDYINKKYPEVAPEDLKASKDNLEGYLRTIKILKGEAN